MVPEENSTSGCHAPIGWRRQLLDSTASGPIRDPLSSRLCNGRKPCGAASTGSLDARGDGVFDVRVQGRVTMNGAPVPAVSGAGSLQFAPQAGGPDVGRGGAHVTLTGDRYSALIVAGTYDVSYFGSATCGTSFTSLPCNGGVIKTGQAILSDGTLDLNVPTAKVRGQLILDGRPAPNTQESRGAIRFQNRLGTAAESPTFPASGSLVYALHVVRGSYIVTYVANRNACQSRASFPLPCIDAMLAGWKLDERHGAYFVGRAYAYPSSPPPQGGEICRPPA